ncbi:MAG TPA: hypothetical protein VI356_03885 [Myxococcales bacterium]
MRWNKELAEKIEPWFRLGAAVVAALWALGEYRARMAEGRVEKTLAYVAQFHEEPVGPAWQRIEDAWDAREQDTLALLAEPQSEQWRARWGAHVLRTVAQARLGPSIAIVAQFFHEMQACAEAGICDAATARAFFKVRATEFYHLHYCYLLARRKELKDPAFGTAIEWMAETASSDGCGEVPAAPPIPSIGIGGVAPSR